MTNMAQGGLSESVWAAIERAGIHLSDGEQEALDELVNQGEARLQSDLENTAVPPAFDAERTAEQVVERLLRRPSAEQTTDRQLAYGSLRDWICPLYPIC